MKLSYCTIIGIMLALVVMDRVDFKVLSILGVLFLLTIVISMVDSRIKRAERISMLSILIAEASYNKRKIR